MHNIYNKIIVLCILLSFQIVKVSGQSYHIGGIGDEYMRILQLQGKLDPNISFTSKPNYANNTISQDSVYSLIDPSYEPLKYISTKYFTFKPLMANVNMKYNSLQPYGWNDEGMIQAKGLQTLTRWGVYSKIGPLSFQYMPEYVNAENPPYDISGDYGSIPSSRYIKNFTGQSSIRLNIKSVSLGWSTENLWWGPGIENSIMMSNNAPGFPHYTFNTTKPIKTAIGFFEWQLIVGRLNRDSSLGFEMFNNQKYSPFNKPAILNGINLTYQPIFFKNIFFGINRTFQADESITKNLSSSQFYNYFPVFSSFFKSSVKTDDGDVRDQRLNIFTRFLFPRSHSEFYFEYGWNDHSNNFRDFWIDPEHSSIYLIGFTKLVPLHDNKWFEINTEITQTSQSPDYLVRNAGDYYYYDNGGYSNENQILGAGSGSGNNLQILKINYIDGFDKIGIKALRLQHQPTSLVNYGPFEAFGIRTIKWNDISIGLIGQKKFQNLILSSEIQFVNSSNYAWMPTSHFNLFCNLNITYLW